MNLRAASPSRVGVKSRPCVAEFKKTRPALVVSPDEMNQALGTVVMAPITSAVRNFPTRYTIRLQCKIASVVLDQIRTVSVERLLKKMTTIDPRLALATSGDVAD